MEFSGFYQPKVNTVYNTVSYEAIIRPPGGQTTEEYINSIKDRYSFDMKVITYFVDALKHSSISLPISFNTFSNSFYQYEFLEMCESKCSYLDFSLEITEHEKIINLVKAKEAMLHLNQLGIEFSLDDYGKGYSNEKRLRALPFTEVKFDKSLVQSIASSFSSYKHLKQEVSKVRDLGIQRIVYEGIENQVMEDLVLECDENAILQGFHYSKLKPISDLIVN